MQWRNCLAYQQIYSTWVKNRLPRGLLTNLFYDVDAKLKSAQGIAKSQYDTNKSQLDTLQSQLSTMQSQLDTQKAGVLTLTEISAKIDALTAQKAALAVKAAATPQSQTESLLQSKADCSTSKRIRVGLIGRRRARSRRFWVLA